MERCYYLQCRSVWVPLQSKFLYILILDANSLGNHAQGVALSGSHLGIPCTIVMPSGTPSIKVRNVARMGAKTILHGADFDEAKAECARLAKLHGLAFVPPYDDPLVIAGAGTVGLEIMEDVPGVDTIVVSCGGGGLVSGIAAACVPAGVRVVAVEPERSNALALGLAAGKPVPVTPETIADALTAPFTGQRPIEICGALGVEVVLVSEDEIREAFRFLYTRAKLAAEPGAAVATAAVLTGKVEGATLVSVVSGGNVSTDIASATLAAP